MSDSLTSDSSKLIPSSSQTVGPFFRIGLEHLVDRMPTPQDDPDAIEIRGKAIDRDGVPVPDAMLEFWGADSSGAYPGGDPGATGRPAGFRRVATDDNGRFSLSIHKPGPASFGDGRLQAPHFLVLFFARGLLRQLITRVYFGDEPGNDADPVLLRVPVERRHTLVATTESGSRIYNWDVVLQGEKETAFFAW